YNNVSQLSLKYIYQSQMVVDIELAGYKIIYELLKVLIEAIMSPKKAYSQQILRRIPAQYDIYSDSNYIKILSVLDYISGMTDVYALDLYRKINGMSLPMI
ncbi:MAG: dehydrogenase, partial [Paludibacteraceae bacterium]|nr:dehydrogenase [Paludibacteraceae bacterium]